MHNCKLSILCSRDGCNQHNNYIVKMVIVNGLDNDIWKEVLGTNDLDNKDLNATLCIIENKELAIQSIMGTMSSPGGRQATSTSRRSWLMTNASPVRGNVRSAVQTS